MKIECRDGSFTISSGFSQSLAKDFPDVNIEAEFGKMLDWLAANPDKLPLADNAQAFVSRWLKRAREAADPASIIPPDILQWLRVDRFKMYQ